MEAIETLNERPRKFGRRPNCLQWWTPRNDERRSLCATVVQRASRWAGGRMGRSLVTVDLFGETSSRRRGANQLRRSVYISQIRRRLLPAFGLACHVVKRGCRPSTTAVYSCATSPDTKRTPEPTYEGFPAMHVDTESPDKADVTNRRRHNTDSPDRLTFLIVLSWNAYRRGCILLEAVT